MEGWLMAKAAQLTLPTQWSFWLQTLVPSTYWKDWLGSVQWSVLRKCWCKGYANIAMALRIGALLCMFPFETISWLFRCSWKRIGIMFWVNLLNGFDTWQVRKHFKPRLLNRLDEIVIFDPLTHEQLRQVARLQLKDIAIRLAERGIALAVTEAALDVILAESYDPVSTINSLTIRLVRRKISDIKGPFD